MNSISGKICRGRGGFIPIKDQFNVLVIGSQDILVRFATHYFSVQISPRKGLTFFKFPPNPISFHMKTIVPQESMNVFLASSYLLKPLVEPKELSRIDGIIVLINPESSTPFSEILPYMEKVVLGLQSFVPTNLFVYFIQNSSQNDDIFFQMVEIKNTLKRIFENPINLGHLHEGVNVKYFEKMLGKFRSDMIKIQPRGKLPKSKVQGFLTEAKKNFLQIERKDYSMEDKLALLMDLEQRIQKPLTKRFLIQRYGLARDFAIDLLNNWEIEYVPEESGKEQALKDALAMHSKSLLSHLDPNFANFASLGYTPYQIQQYVTLLKQNDSLEPRLSAFHIPHNAFADYLNIKELILLNKEQPIWHRQPAGSDEEKIVLFSALIQAIELLRNDFFQKFEDIELFPRNNLDILDFGPLKAVIGQSRCFLKIIARLKSSPSQKLIQRIRNFLGIIDAVFDPIGDPSPQNYMQYYDKVQHLFSETFNPFPIFVRVHERYRLQNYQRPEEFTCLEQQIIERIKEKSDRTLIEIVQNIFNEGYFAESDVITTIIELIRQKTLKIEL